MARKFWKGEVVALTSVILALSACKQDKVPSCNQTLAAQVSDSSLKSEQKMGIVASAVEDLQSQICCISEQNVHGTWGGKTSPHYTTDSFFITAEFLYWEANEDGLEYATVIDNFSLNGLVNGSGAASGGTDLQFSNYSSKFKEMDFEWNPGFRIGIGTEMGCHDHWDLYLNYTHIRNKAHGFTSIDPNVGIIFPASNVYNLGFASSDAEAHWHVDLNTLDLELGKDYFVGTSLSVRPHLGLRGAMINQKYKFHSDPFTLGPPANTLKAKNDFSCIGVRAGSDMLWHFSEHFGIYGEISGALVYGKFRVKESSVGTDTQSRNGAFTHNSNEEKFWRTRCNVETAIGLEWEEIFNSDDFRVALSVGYELSEWFQMNQFIQTIHSTLLAHGAGGAADIIGIATPYNQRSNGNLGFQGGTLRLTFDF